MSWVINVIISSRSKTVLYIVLVDRLRLHSIIATMFKVWESSRPGNDKELRVHDGIYSLIYLILVYLAYVRRR